MDVEGRRHDGFKREEEKKERKGKMPEWLKGLVLKTRDRKGSVGSNPTFPEEKRKEERERTHVNKVRGEGRGKKEKGKKRKKIEERREKDRERTLLTCEQCERRWKM